MRSTRSVIVDLLARGIHDVPLGAELVQALAVHVAGLLVARVVVERMAVVGDDRRAVRRPRGAHLPGGYPPAHGRLAVRAEGGPHAEAPARAGAHVRLVGFEHVEAAALTIDEEGAEARLG